MNTYKKIGWIGLGHMGTPMSLNLLNAGFNVTVYNRSKDKLAKLVEAGAHVSVSLIELCTNSDIIFTMVSDDDAVKSVYAELLKANVTGKLFINMSTVSPETSKAIASSCIYKAASFLEAPVSGSVKPATDGTLILLIGGKKEDYDKALPLFGKLGKSALYLGDVGIGASAKLAINYYLAVTIQGISETVLFAERKGISRECMMDIINESACGSAISSIKKASIVNDAYPPAFPLKHMAKDVRLARDQGLRLPLAKTVYESFSMALNQGLGEEDVMAIITSLKSNG